MIVCSPQLGLSPKSTLGGEVHDFNLIKSLSKEGVKFEVLIPKNKPSQMSSTIKIVHLPFSHIVPAHLFNLISLPYLFKKYALTKFTILRLHNPYYLGLAGLVFKKIHPQVKIVTTIHLKEERWDLDLILSSTIHIYDHIFTVSEYLKRWLVTRYQVRPDKITVIYNGVDPILKPAKKDKGLVKRYKLEDKIVLLSMGLFIERKNPLFLLELFKKLLTKHPECVLILCGNGPLKSKMKSIILENKLQDQVIIHDPAFGEDKNKLINLADIFLFPSRAEGFGIVAAEAMACAKPVVGSANSSIPEVVSDGISGMLCKTSDLNKWYQAVEGLIEDPKLRQKFGRNGYKIARSKFIWDKVADKTLSIYKGL